MTKINELYKAIRKDPSLLSAISNAENKEAAPTRAMPGLSDSAVADALKEILGQDASDQEVNEVMKELENNNLVRKVQKYYEFLLLSLLFDMFQRLNLSIY